MCKKVLVVEDDKDIRNALRDTLHILGYEVDLAENGQIALTNLLSGVLPRPCLILLDLMMPVMDGWRFREAQRNDPSLANIPVVVISADGNAEQKAQKMGAETGISKPFLVEDLQRVASQYCNS
jgi:CheY-like chemotaxis protein